MVEIRQIVKAHRDLVVNTRRDLHRIPETAYTEKKTSVYVTEFLKPLDLDIHTGVAEFGVVGLLKTGRPGPTLMIRADMDALPLTEETGLEYASVHKGVMHACGHDAHIAMVLTSAKVLESMKDTLSGNIKFVFQPAEEGPGGANPMIDAGVMENPRVDYCIGCHLWPAIPEGTIGVKPGPFMAAMDTFEIKIFGRGGHAAMPHLCIDPLEVGTQVVNALQRIVSRQMDPLEPSVVTVASFQSGTTFNIIPAEAILKGTTRTFKKEIWQSWEKRIEKVVRGVCHSMGAEFKLEFTKGYPPTINDDFMADVVRRNAEKVVGREKVVEPNPTMVGEDMSFFLEKSQGCYFALGIGRVGCVALHNPKFEFNEDALTLGVETFCQVAFDLLT